MSLTATRSYPSLPTFKPDDFSETRSHRTDGSDSENMLWQNYCLLLAEAKIKTDKITTLSTSQETKVQFEISPIIIKDWLYSIQHHLMTKKTNTLYVVFHNKTALVVPNIGSNQLSKLKKCAIIQCKKEDFSDYLQPYLAEVLTFQKKTPNIGKNKIFKLKSDNTEISATKISIRWPKEHGSHSIHKQSEWNPLIDMSGIAKSLHSVCDHPDRIIKIKTINNGLKNIKLLILFVLAGQTLRKNIIQSYTDRVDLSGFEDYSEATLTVFSDFLDHQRLPIHDLKQKPLDNKDLISLIELAFKFDFKFLIHDCLLYLTKVVINFSNKELVSLQAIAEKYKSSQLSQFCSNYQNNVTQNFELPSKSLKNELIPKILRDLQIISESDQHYSIPIELLSHAKDTAKTLNDITNSELKLSTSNKNIEIWIDYLYSNQINDHPLEDLISFLSFCCTNKFFVLEDLLLKKIKKSLSIKPEKYNSAAIQNLLKIAKDFKLKKLEEYCESFKPKKKK